jgi:hypothetical protein
MPILLRHDQEHDTAESGKAAQRMNIEAESRID